jgi:hypothetical protein
MITTIITHIDSGNIDSGTIDFPRGESIINYGTATVSTYNLVNCIAIGGRFKYGENSTGIFFTHESPTDSRVHKNTLQTIKDTLKDTLVTHLYIFRIEPSQAEKGTYADGSTTESVIAEMIRFTRDLFALEPIILNYECDTKTFRCGKASISVDDARTSMAGLVEDDLVEPTPDVTPVLGIFEPNYLKNKSGDTIIECPICNSKSGTTLEITHAYDCPNKGKKADLSRKPSKGGVRHKMRKTYKQIKKRRRKTARRSKVRSKVPTSSI